MCAAARCCISDRGDGCTCSVDKRRGHVIPRVQGFTPPAGVCAVRRVGSFFVATYIFRDRKAGRSGPYRDSTFALAQVLRQAPWDA